MSGFALHPVILRFCLLALALPACSWPLAGQVTTSGSFTFLNSNGRSRTGTDAAFNIHVYFMDRNGANSQEFYVPTALDFDYAGAEANDKKIRIVFSFPNDRNLRIILRRDCIGLPAGMNIYGPASLGKTQDPPYSTDGFIDLVAQSNGAFNIDIDYDVMHGSLDPLSFPCAQRNTISFSGVIRGIRPRTEAPPPPVVDKAEICRKKIAEAKNNKDCARLIDLAMEGCSGAAEAFAAIKKDLMTQCQNKNLNACEDYLDCDPNGDFVLEAKRIIDKARVVEPEKPEDPAVKAWKSIANTRNYAQFLNFYNTYPNSSYARNALDSMSKYFDWSVVLIDKPENRRIYQIDSFSLVKGLRWKDVSVGTGLVVDMSTLSSDGRILVEFQEQGDYLLYFEDSFGQRDSISFSTQLKGKLKKGNKDYTVLFESGTGPYTVELVDANTNKPVKTYTDVAKDSLVISMDEVAALNLSQIKVWVKDKTGLKASVEGDILASNPLDFKKIAALAVITLLSLLVIYLLASFIRRRRMNVQFQ